MYFFIIAVYFFFQYKLMFKQLPLIFLIAQMVILL